METIVPNQAEVANFQRLFKERFNVSVNEEEALRALKTLGHIYYAKYIALGDLRPEE